MLKKLVLLSVLGFMSVAQAMVTNEAQAPSVTTTAKVLDVTLAEVVNQLSAVSTKEVTAENDELDKHDDDKKATARKKGLTRTQKLAIGLAVAVLVASVSYGTYVYLNSKPAEVLATSSTVVTIPDTRTIVVPTLIEPVIEADALVAVNNTLAAIEKVTQDINELTNEVKNNQATLQLLNDNDEEVQSPLDSVTRYLSSFIIQPLESYFEDI